MKKKYVYLFVISYVFFSCSSEKSENPLTYSCDVDNVFYWSGKEECKKIKGHTGEYCAFVDSTKEYGFGFKMSPSEISDKPLRKVRFTTWILSDNPASQVAYVLSIEKDGKVFLYKGIKVVDFMENKNEWFQVVGEVEIPDNVPKDADVLLYIWSPDKSYALADDFEISFE